jgi:hypothetical protein
MVIADRPVLSLVELELHDPNPSGHGAERRFLCPFPACADHQRREHKNLAANIESGLWACKRCGASGKLTEKWERKQQVRPTRVLRLGPYEKARRAMGLTGTPISSSQHVHVGGTQVVERTGGTGTSPRGETDTDEHPSTSARERVPSWRRRWEQAVPVAGTPGETYLVSRGIPIDTATAAGVRYLERWEHWSRDERGDWHLEGTSRRVVFPIVDRAGEQIGIQGRRLGDGDYGEKMLTNGHGGIFAAGTPWPLTEQLERVAIVEAPIDALSLAAAGVATLATQGTSWPEWLPLALAFKKVLLAHDNDAPEAGERAGDLAAASMVPALRSYGAEPERLRPRSKDWNQDLQEQGQEQVWRVIHGERAIALLAVTTTTTAEAPDEACPAASTSDALGSATSARSAESAVETSCSSAEPIAAGERAEVEELLDWLQTTELPSAPVRLWPWVSVADMPRFVGRLQAELSAAVVGPGWRAAAADLRQLARLHRGTASEGCGSPERGRAPPLACAASARSTRQTATTQVVGATGVAGSSVG